MKIWLVNGYSVDKSTIKVDYSAFGPNICMNLIDDFPKEVYDIHENFEFGPNLYPSNVYEEDLPKPATNAGAEFRNALTAFERDFGLAALGKEIIGVFTSDQRALLARMIAGNRELEESFSEHSRSIVSSKKLSQDDIESLREYAPYRSWLSRREFGYPWRMNPVEFIKIEYKYWIDRGMTRAELRFVDGDLVSKLDKWLAETGDKLPSNFLPVLGYESKRAEETISPELREAVLRLDARDRGRKSRAVAGLSKKQGPA